MKQLFHILLLLLGFTLQAQITEQELDKVVEKTMSTFNVPGIAVAIVKDGKIVISKGYGVKSIKTKEKVDGNTLFGIASNSKAFTATALAILVDEGKLNWDDKVIKYLPEFKMYNEYVIQEFTIRDLLTHRSGLGLGAGDLMIWPDGHNFTPKDIINNIQYLKPVSAFRTKYDYDNLLYVIAGEVVAKISGTSWNDFVEERIMQPLDMKKSASSWNRVQDTTNVIVPHVPVKGQLQIIKRYTNPIFDAAAGLYTNTNELSNWLIMQMNKGVYNGKRIVSEKQHKEMWTSQTIMPVRKLFPYTCNFDTYGLGWRLTDLNGHLQISHTGGLGGIVTQTMMFPDINLGIIVLTNQQSGAAFTAISNTIKDRYYNFATTDHVERLGKNVQQNEDNDDKALAEVWNIVENNTKNKITVQPHLYIGTYTDAWFGDVIITEKKGKMYFASVRSPKLAGELFFYKENTFVVKWNTRTFNADAYLYFNPSNKNFSMKAISDLTDFSYDFQDLYFTKKNN